MGVENKKSEDGEVVRNKARLVSQGYSQKERIDCGSVGSNRILLVFVFAKGFKLFQMDVNIVFLNRVIEEEVYVRQLSGFESAKYPYRVYKLRKTLYGLKQAPRAWYGRLRGFFSKQGVCDGDN
jgi:hypothetical protein